MQKVPVEVFMMKWPGAARHGANQRASPQGRWCNHRSPRHNRTTPTPTRGAQTAGLCNRTFSHFYLCTEAPTACLYKTQKNEASVKKPQGYIYFYFLVEAAELSMK